jgi:glycine/D-amino acid oxidase-like deaminating enzyme
MGGACHGATQRDSLGAGIVGTSVALHLVKRGLAVALVDRRASSEETSYGNAGVIESNMLLAFPSELLTLLRRIAMDGFGIVTLSMARFSPAGSVLWAFGTGPLRLAHHGKMGMRSG